LTRESKQQSEVNNLMDIYHIILKETHRQQKLFQKRMTANKTQKKITVPSRESSAIEDKPVINIIAPG
jgi:hypothetical protein